MCLNGNLFDDFEFLKTCIVAFKLEVNLNSLSVEVILFFGIQ